MRSQLSRKPQSKLELRVYEGWLSRRSQWCILINTLTNITRPRTLSLSPKACCPEMVADEIHRTWEDTQGQRTQRMSSSPDPHQNNALVVIELRRGLILILQLST